MLRDDSLQLSYYRPVADAKSVRKSPPRTPQARNWKIGRGLFRTSLAFIFVPVAFFFGPHVILFGKLTTPTPADFAGCVTPDCVRIVRAMKQYQLDHCVLPDRPEQLIPKYLGSEFPDQMHLYASGGFYTLSNDNDLITYDFTPASEGWYVNGEFVHGRIPVGAVSLNPSTQP
jgi:hypothetical protein